MADVVGLAELLLTAIMQACRCLHCCRSADLSYLLCIMVMSFNITVSALGQLQAGQTRYMQLLVVQDPVSYSCSYARPVSFVQFTRHIS